MAQYPFIMNGLALALYRQYWRGRGMRWSEIFRYRGATDGILISGDEGPCKKYAVGAYYWETASTVAKCAKVWRIPDIAPLPGRNYGRVIQGAWELMGGSPLITAYRKFHNYGK